MHCRWTILHFYAKLKTDCATSSVSTLSIVPPEVFRHDRPNSHWLPELLTVSFRNPRSLLHSRRGKARTLLITHHCRAARRGHRANFHPIRGVLEQTTEARRRGTKRERGQKTKSTGRRDEDHQGRSLRERRERSGCCSSSRWVVLEEPVHPRMGRVEE